MRKLIFLSIVTLLLSCGKDPGITDAELQGTWILASVSGDCASIPITGSADAAGCIENPTLEVNCSIIEFTGPSTLVYAYNFVRGQGTYSFSGEKISICTDRCLDYIYDGSSLTLQTGTVPLCDPIYSFSKSSQSLEEIISSNQKKVIKSVMQNGQLRYSYNYNADGSIQTKQTYTSTGDLNVKDIYTFTPLTTTVLRTIFPSNSTYRYEYYNEAPNRLRRDYYNNSNVFQGYRLYFINPNGCWVDRTEDYENNLLVRLYNYDYSGDNCDLEVTAFSNGQQLFKSVSTKDGMAPWSKSTLLNILQFRNVSNTLSYTYSEENIVDAQRSYTSSYTYDESGFPTSQTQTYLDGNVNFYNYIYE